MNNPPPQGPSALDRDRDRGPTSAEEEQHIRLRQQEEIALREREHNERERLHREQQYQSVPQHQNNTGAIPIHQPVASRVHGVISSPGGLLASHGGSAPSGPLGAPAGPGNAFGGPLHNEPSRSIQQHNQPSAVSQPQHQIFGPGVINHPPGSSAPLGQQAPPANVFGGPLQQETAARSIQQIPFGGPAVHQVQGNPALAQGQQPILNDALSYLDQVKVQFVDQPDVYNRFLDIMKDFKSQAIDTPGVINRVSELFAGHPNLIQGFNTFLPPGYRIECGAGNDPNTIRVTTPMGTTVQSITGAGRALPEGSTIGPNGAFYPGQRGNNWQQQQPQHSIESPEGVFSPQSRNGAPPYGQNQAANASYEAQQAAAVHQQEQRGVSQLQNAVATATGHQVPRNALTPTPNAQGPGLNGAAAQPGIEKRGPVEFNHAISYVNKIKNRFQDKPEIYKQFLEILQTYQRESKPIQDVYAQVTTLFGSAPDLLEDFKQFLPESAAQAKAAAKAAEDAAALGIPGVAQTPQPPRGDQKLPPVGNFPPPSASKEGKKRSRPGQAAGAVAMQPLVETSALRSTVGQGANVNKRTKISHGGRPAEDVPAVSPTLTPQRPQPLSPTPLPASQQPEVAFFDKVKKYLSNKQTFAEFLKLCNLYSQDLIDKNVLVHKASNFIGTNVELMDFFKKFVEYTGTDEVVENKPRAPSGRVSLSNCRGLGPSYRLLPKRYSKARTETSSKLYHHHHSLQMASKKLLPSNAHEFSDARNWPQAEFSFVRGDCGLDGHDPSKAGGQNYVYLNHTPHAKRAAEQRLSIWPNKRPRTTPAEKEEYMQTKRDVKHWGALTYLWQERLKPCSGRDEMCYSVLNDDWASHPTWASEDSGFVAHRKNIFEEALHRIEEERHDYDFNIEANAKVIQLLEPVGHQILNLSEAELANFRLPAGFGGQSQSIYKRVLKKVYGAEKGVDVANDLFIDPVAVIPVVLARLKQKDEEWRFTQREWNKVWNAQTQIMYLKSLDHMGIHVKQADKKMFSPKNIVDLIKLKHEEQRRQRSLGANATRYQYRYDFEDKDVVIDAIRLAIVYVNNSNQHNANERDRLIDYLDEFVPVFFGIPLDAVEARVKDISRGSPDDELEDAIPELLNGRGRRTNGKAGLLRGVLDRGRGGKGRGQKEDSAASGSKESTPDIGSAVEDEDVEVTEAPDGGDEASGSEAGPERWLSKNPAPTAMVGTNPLESTDLELKADQPFKRDWYNLYSNVSIFVFFTLFELLYRRLKALKESEEDVIEAVRNIRSFKPAKDIGLLEERNDWFTADSPDSYYSRALLVIEEYILNEIDEARYQDFLRNYYLKSGWQVYTISELLKQVCRFAALCSTADGKDKTPDIIRGFEANRASEETTYNIEIEQRKKVEKIVKDGDMFLIRYFPNRSSATAQFIVKDETTFELTDMERKERWKYYVSSFVRIEPTEGVPRDRLRNSVLVKNLPSGEAESEDGSVQQSRKPLYFEENLVLRICVNTFRLTYKAGTAEYFVYESNKRDRANTSAQATAVRNQRFKEKWHMNSPWKEGLSHEVVSKVSQEFDKFLSDGEIPTTAYTLPKRTFAKRATRAAS